VVRADNGRVEPLLESIGDARLVLIGEASHDTHEFYQVRAEVTKALIARKDFNVVAVEADYRDHDRRNDDEVPKRLLTEPEPPPVEEPQVRVSVDRTLWDQ
jgi:erythromycin esterase-like protein